MYESCRGVQNSEKSRHSKKISERFHLVFLIFIGFLYIYKVFEIKLPHVALYLEKYSPNAKKNRNVYEISTEFWTPQIMYIRMCVYIYMYTVQRKILAGENFDEFDEFC